MAQSSKHVGPLMKDVGVEFPNFSERREKSNGSSTLKQKSDDSTLPTGDLGIVHRVIENLGAEGMDPSTLAILKDLWMSKLEKRQQHDIEVVNLGGSKTDASISAVGKLSRRARSAGNVRQRKQVKVDPAALPILAASEQKRVLKEFCIPLVDRRFAKNATASKAKEDTSKCALISTCRDEMVGMFKAFGGPAQISQMDGLEDSTDEDDDDDKPGKDDEDDFDLDDLDDDDDDEDSGDEDSDGAEEEPICSGDDISDEEPNDLFDSDNLIICQYEKITRNKNRWKLFLKDGVMNINGCEKLFRTAIGETEW